MWCPDNYSDARGRQAPRRDVLNSARVRHTGTDTIIAHKEYAATFTMNKEGGRIQHLARGGLGVRGLPTETTAECSTRHAGRQQSEMYSQFGECGLDGDVLPAVARAPAARPRGRTWNGTIANPQPSRRDAAILLTPGGQPQLTANLLRLNIAVSLLFSNGTIIQGLSKGYSAILAMQFRPQRAVKFLLSCGLWLEIAVITRARCYRSYSEPLKVSFK